MNQNKISELIYRNLKEKDIKEIISLIDEIFKEQKTEKTKITKTPLLISIGNQLGKLIIKDEKNYNKLINLFKLGNREEKLIVIGAFSYISKKQYNKTKEFILNTINDISNWEICDQLALKVIVNLAIKNQEDIFSIMQEWIKHKDKWIRRLAIAVIPPYIRAKNNEAKICLGLIDKLMQEEDKDVKKAIAWALREISKKDNIAVFQFLNKWLKIDNKNTKWIIKNGIKKLNPIKQKEILEKL